MDPMWDIFFTINLVCLTPLFDIPLNPGCFFWGSLNWLVITPIKLGISCLILRVVQCVHTGGVKHLHCLTWEMFEGSNIDLLLGGSNGGQ